MVLLSTLPANTESLAYVRIINPLSNRIRVPHTHRTVIRRAERLVPPAGSDIADRPWSQPPRAMDAIVVILPIPPERTVCSVVAVDPVMFGQGNMQDSHHYSKYRGVVPASGYFFQKTD
jgi:hypothetical protein